MHKSSLLPLPCCMLMMGFEQIFADTETKYSKTLVCILNSLDVSAFSSHCGAQESQKRVTTEKKNPFSFLSLRDDVTFAEKRQTWPQVKNDRMKVHMKMQLYRSTRKSKQPNNAKPSEVCSFHLQHMGRPKLHISFQVLKLSAAFQSPISPSTRLVSKSSLVGVIWWLNILSSLKRYIIDCVVLVCGIELRLCFSGCSPIMYYYLLPSSGISTL